MYIYTYININKYKQNMDGAAADALKSSFDAKALQKLLTQTGPVCKCVFVRLWRGVIHGGSGGHRTIPCLSSDLCQA